MHFIDEAAATESLSPQVSSTPDPTQSPTIAATDEKRVLSALPVRILCSRSASRLLLLLFLKFADLMQVTNSRGVKFTIPEEKNLNLVCTRLNAR